MTHGDVHYGGPPPAPTPRRTGHRRIVIGLIAGLAALVALGTGAYFVLRPEPKPAAGTPEWRCAD